MLCSPHRNRENLMPQLVFGVGLSKTGTTSLAKALDLMGYRCSHYPLGAMRYQNPHPTLTKILNSIGYRFFNKPIGVHQYQLQKPSIDLSGFASYDAFADIPIAYCYRDLDKQYPGSKFILTVRNVDAWIKSCRWHFGRPYRPGRPKWWHDEEMGSWNDQMTDYLNRLNYDVYKTIAFDEKLFRLAYARHLAEVSEYFSGREGDLLMIDITSGQGWEPICSFLGKPVPASDFPVENVTKTTKA